MGSSIGCSKLIQRRRVDAHHGFGFIDQAFARHVHGHAQRRRGGALAVAGLQHVQLVLLHGELDVLHVLVVFFQLRADFHQFRVGVGIALPSGISPRFGDRGRQGLRRADAGDNVLALGVHQVFAVEHVFAGGGSRVKQTPVAQSLPMLPNTIACTLTAVPQPTGISCRRR